MKKLAGIIIIVVIAVVIAAPYFTGKFAETQVNNLVSNLNETQLQNGTTEILTYERSMFSSTSTYRYSLPTHLNQIFGNIGTFEYGCDINHGITGVDYVCRIINNEAYTNFINDYFDGNDPVSMNGVAGLFGGLTQFLTIEEIKDLQEDGTTLNLAKTELSLTTDKSFSDFSVNGALPSMSIVDEDGTITLNDLVIEADLKKIQNNLFSGNTNFNVDNFKFDMADESLSLSNFKFVTNTKENGENLDSGGTLSFDESTTSKTDSPFSTIEDVKVEIQINGLNQAALAEYNAFAKQMQMDLMSSLNNDTQPSQSPADFMQVLPILEKMLTEELDFDIGFSGKFDDQENSMQLSLDLLDSVTMADAMTFAVAPQDALKKIDIKLAASFDKDTLNSQPGASITIENNPLFKESSDSYNINLELGSEIELNGEAMTFEELQMMVMTSAMQ